MRRTDLNRRVVVTGIGIITAHGIGVKTNWSRISAGISAIQEIETFESSIYRGKNGGELKEDIISSVSNIKKSRINRASLLLINAVCEALENANLTSSISNEELLLSLGTTLGGMLSGQAFHQEVIQRSLQRARTSLTLDYLAHHQAMNIFKEFKLKGDMILFSNACASSTNAIGHAFNSICKGYVEVAICGGYDSMSEFTFAGFNSLMAISPTLCRPFDNNRDGLVLGEGAGILVLEELDHAISRKCNILAEVAGYGESADAYHMTSPDPAGEQASNAITYALKDAGSPDIDYINAHGTGTRFNDVMETNAIFGSLGNHAETVPVSSIKPMIGHLLGGSGAVEAIISILSIINKLLPPNLNYETSDPECALNIIREPLQHNVKTVLSNSFGFGGANAALILREYL